MKTFDIVPHRGIGPITFGMTRDEVRDILGPPEHTQDERDWFLKGFGVDFDDTAVVEFIELANSPEFVGLYRGKSLHEMDADDAVAFVALDSPFDQDLPDLGHSYVFPELQLSLWRPTVPAPGQSPDDPDGRRFHAVGVARVGYFES
jgi:hypothetical protein